MSETITEKEALAVTITLFQDLKKENDELKKELDQQRFNNKHNLSIDQKVADRIKELEERLKEAVLIIEFYANPMSHYSDHEGGGFNYCQEDDLEDLEILIKEFGDTEPDFYENVGGKKAREFLQKIGGEA